MKNLIEWIKAIGIVIGIVIVVYAAWIVAIITALLGVVYILKVLMEEEL